ncbi:hypothetical protein G7K_5449-t1 [Saitoella complicata NRRL Y-17804]|uniref:Uncharacterized protein n=1 Tax=Saitoella complicata (strain BCRC 22490 / CBS 7301 / JCM 7358 / NBRC 10748 / NRRL Y-17804) TaxID=698492 RepID=A0A0E9NN87_SAICN|nr:hypothetical protein G7K_5449-t1 [Saitoella complicata NRRL Y-17804]
MSSVYGLFEVEMALEACASPGAFNDTAVATSYLRQFWSDVSTLFDATPVEGSPTGYSFDCEATTTDDTGTAAATSSAAAMTT